MSDMIKRQKIVEREYFSYEEKQRIAKKSDDRCCHCGKKVFTNYGATVEHFIPLDKGGTNRDINLIMLCEECNKKKNNFIYDPDDYLIYLKKEHMDKIKGYFDSYIRSFDFVNRDNLLACDRYRVYVNTMPDEVFYNLMNRKKNRKKAIELIKKSDIPMWVKRATMDDLDKLTDYYIKYLKRYDCLDSENAARINIEFWLTFGCIYYVENHGDIKAFVTIMVTKTNDKVYVEEDSIDYFLTINVFCYYSTRMATDIAYGLARHVPRHIEKEQGLRQIPVKYCVLENDRISEEICGDGAVFHGDRFIFTFLVLFDRDRSSLPKIKDDKNLQAFFHKFAKINQMKADEWFKKHGGESYDWLINELELLDFNYDEEEEDVGNS